MENLLILPSQNVPFIMGDTDKGELCILGKSTPHNIVEIIKSTEDWIRFYLNGAKNPLIFNVDLGYYDTPTSLMLTGIFSMLSHNYGKNGAVVYWNFYSNDDDLMENGEDYRDMVKFPFMLIENKRLSSINIKQTRTSPLVYLDDTGDFIIQGASQLEDPLGFYRQIIRWLSDELVTPTLKKISLEIYLQSISPSNAPFVQAIIHLVEALHQNGVKTAIQWGYSSAEIEELGTQFLSSLKSHFAYKNLS